MSDFLTFVFTLMNYIEKEITLDGVNWNLLLKDDFGEIKFMVFDEARHDDFFTLDAESINVYTFEKCVDRFMNWYNATGFLQAEDFVATQKSYDYCD